MNEKMTDEQLNVALAYTLDPYGPRLRAHIAALTAERDEAVKREKMTRESIRETHLDMDNARCSGTNRPIEERIRLLWEERDEARKEREQFRADLVRMSEFAFQGGTGSPVTQEGNDALESIGGLWNKADALRERVKALEAQCTKLAQERDAEWTTRRAAESRLAAIRTTARTLQSMSLSTVMGGEWNRQASALIREMAGGDARPSAPPEAFTHEKGLDAGVFDESAQGAASPAQEDWDGQHPHDEPEETAPTTPEAFATVRMQLREELFPHLARNGGASLKDCEDRAEAALSLLERRMGVQEAAIRSTIAAYEDKRAMGKPIRALKSALTDAPLVFTLGEVKEALTEHIGDLPEAVNEVMDRLTAMRK